MDPECHCLHLSGKLCSDKVFTKEQNVRLVQIERLQDENVLVAIFLILTLFSKAAFSPILTMFSKNFFKDINNWNCMVNDQPKLHSGCY